MTSNIETLFAPGVFEMFINDIENHEDTTSFNLEDSLFFLDLRYTESNKLLTVTIGYETTKLKLILAVTDNLINDLKTFADVFNEYYTS